MNEKQIRETMEKEVLRLREVALTSTQDCLIAEYIAVSDKDVQNLLFKKVGEGYVFQGIKCLNTLMLERRYVEIKFACADGSVCLIPPTFMVIVDMISKSVERIVDPYLHDELLRMTERQMAAFDLRHQQQTLMTSRHNNFPTTQTLAWDGYGPFSTHPNQMGHTTHHQHSQWNWAPQLHLTHPMLDTLRLHAEVSPPNLSYHERPAYVQSHVGHQSSETVTVILPIQYREQTGNGNAVIARAFELDIPTLGKKELEIFVEVDGQIVSRTKLPLLTYVQQPMTSAR